MDGLMIPGQQDTGKGHCDEIGYERYICKKKKKRKPTYGKMAHLLLCHCYLVKYFSIEKNYQGNGNS